MSGSPQVTLLCTASLGTKIFTQNLIKVDPKNVLFIPFQNESMSSRGIIFFFMRPTFPSCSAILSSEVVSRGGVLVV